MKYLYSNIQEDLLRIRHKMGKTSKIVKNYFKSNFLSNIYISIKSRKHILQECKRYFVIRYFFLLLGIALIFFVKNRELIKI